MDIAPYSTELSLRAQIEALSEQLRLGAAKHAPDHILGRMISALIVLFLRNMLNSFAKLVALAEEGKLAPAPTRPSQSPALADLAQAEPVPADCTPARRGFADWALASGAAGIADWFSALWRNEPAARWPAEAGPADPTHSGVSDTDVSRADVIKDEPARAQSLPERGPANAANAAGAGQTRAGQTADARTGADLRPPHPAAPAGWARPGEPTAATSIQPARPHVSLSPVVSLSPRSPGVPVRLTKLAGFRRPLRFA